MTTKTLDYAFSNSVAEGCEAAGREIAHEFANLSIICLRNNARPGADGQILLGSKLIGAIEAEQHCRRRTAEKIISRHHAASVRFTVVIALESRAASRHLTAIASDMVESRKLIVVSVRDALCPRETHDDVFNAMTKLVPGLIRQSLGINSPQDYSAKKSAAPRSDHHKPSARSC
jgi:hypothetical protein